MNLSSNQKRFFAELIGTFVVVALATGSVVINAQHGGKIGLWFEAFAPFVAVSLMVYAFGKISMAHFNPAVTVTFLITRHMPKNQLFVYLSAEFIGAFLASLFVKFVIGTDANLGANAPNYFYPLPIIFVVEIIATVLLLAVILAVVHTKGLYGGSGLAIGGIVGLDILFFSFISGASMNPIRALAPAVLSGVLSDLWLYWSATFVGAVIVSGIYRTKFTKAI
jgi:aquaporin Z